MLEVLHREFVYLWYYFELQLRQILPYWVLGMVIGSAISVFGKKAINTWPPPFPRAAWPTTGWRRL